jgi:hypothetical protein
MYAIDVAERRQHFQSAGDGAASRQSSSPPSNPRRLLEPIGNIPPAEAEARFYAELEHRAEAA